MNDHLFHAKVSPEPNTGCWLWTAAHSPFGYGYFQRNRRSCMAHRVSWEYSRGPIPEGMKVLHKCDVPACVNPDHLFLGTTADNNRDSMTKGRNSRGEGRHTAKLTESQVLEIRAKHVPRPPGCAGRRPGKHMPGSIAALAAEYGVNHYTVELIVKRRTWKHVA